MGASELRYEALSDPRVIDYVNQHFVPVWINVRVESLPDLPFWSEVLINAHLDYRNRIVDPFSDGFFLRTVVLSPDGRTLLNPQASTVQGSLANNAKWGFYSYAQMKTRHFLPMLETAWSVYEAGGWAGKTMATSN